MCYIISRLPLCLEKLGPMNTQQSRLLVTSNSTPRQARWLAVSGRRVPLSASASPPRNARNSRGASLTAKPGDAVATVHPVAPACAGMYPLSCLLKIFHGEWVFQDKTKQKKQQLKRGQETQKPHGAAGAAGTAEVVTDWRSTLPSHSD